MIATPTTKQESGAPDTLFISWLVLISPMVPMRSGLHGKSDLLRTEGLTGRVIIVIVTDVGVPGRGLASTLSCQPGREGS